VRGGSVLSRRCRGSYVLCGFGRGEHDSVSSDACERVFGGGNGLSFVSVMTSAR